MSTEEIKHETPQTPEEKQKSSQKSVLNYLLVLFAAAFCLLILTLLMEQRTNDELVDQIYAQVDYEQSSHNATMMQRDELQAALKKSEAKYADLEETLEDTVTDYEEQIAELQEELETTTNLVAELQSTLNKLNPATEAQPTE